MQDVIARLLHVITLARTRNMKHLRFASLVTILLAALFWRTQWLTLRPGLLVLLAGQLGTALFLVYRTGIISKNLRELQQTAVLSSDVLGWLDAEQTFVKRLAFLENASRVIGFVLLAYGFWVATQSLWLAFAIGVVYPVTAYFGIGRKNTVRTLRDLEAQKNSF